MVTTFYPMYEFTKNVAGNLADVGLLIPSTIEAHDWELGPKDMEEEEEEVQAHMTIQILPISVLYPCILMQWNCNFLIQYRRVMSLKCEQDVNQMLQLNIWINCLQIVIITIL